MREWSSVLMSSNLENLVTLKVPKLQLVFCCEAACDNLRKVQKYTEVHVQKHRTDRTPFNLSMSLNVAFPFSKIMIITRLPFPLPSLPPSLFWLLRKDAAKLDSHNCLVQYLSHTEISFILFFVWTYFFKIMICLRLWNAREQCHKGI